MEVKTKEGMRIISVVDAPQLIKVLTIKEKYVEQMSKLETIPVGCDVVGLLRHAFVIIRLENGKLAKVHSLDWITGLMGNYVQGSDIKEYHKKTAEAYKVMDKYPQLFED